MSETSKAREIWEEFRSVVLGRGNVVDSVAPPLVFLVVQRLFGFTVAVWVALALALLIGLLRLARGQSWYYALGGLAGVGLAALLAELLGRAEGYFLPSILNGILTIILCLVSILVRRPLVAWTSHLARRWPRAWYWHPRVRPAYTEVTWFWAAFFALRVGIQVALFRWGNADWLALLQVIMGWPATIVLLVFSYLYGTWRLRRLGGPSVEEFKQEAEPPWEGQRRGF